MTKKVKTKWGGGYVAKEKIFFCQLLRDNLILTFSKVFILIPREFSKVFIKGEIKTVLQVLLRRKNSSSGKIIEQN